MTATRSRVAQRRRRRAESSIDTVNTARALRLNTNDSRIEGLTIHDSSGGAVADGIQVTGNENRSRATSIGTSTTGADHGLLEPRTGVAINGDRNVVSGEAIEDGNLISESDGDGLARSPATRTSSSATASAPVRQAALGNFGERRRGDRQREPDRRP